MQKELISAILHNVQYVQQLKQFAPGTLMGIMRHQSNKKIETTSFAPSEWSVGEAQKHAPYLPVQPPFS